MEFNKNKNYRKLSSDIRKTIESIFSTVGLEHKKMREIEE